MQPITVNIYFDGDSKKKLARGLDDALDAMKRGLMQAKGEPAGVQVAEGGDLGEAIMRAVNGGGMRVVYPAPSPANEAGPETLEVARARNEARALREDAHTGARLLRKATGDAGEWARYEAEHGKKVDKVLAGVARGNYLPTEAIAELVKLDDVYARDFTQRIEQFAATGKEA